MNQITNIWRNDIEPIIKEQITILKENLDKQRDFSDLALLLAQQLESIDIETSKELEENDDMENTNSEEEQEKDSV